MSQYLLIIQEIMKAPSQQIFTAWSEPELMQQWFFPPRANWSANSKNEFKVGGLYRHEMRNNEQTYLHTGQYKEIIPDKRIVFSWNYSRSVVDTIVTIELDELVDGTMILLAHQFLADEETRNEHIIGWQDILKSLNAWLAKENDGL